MKIDSRMYLHDADKAALAALKAIPGFQQLTKAFMKVWNEKQFRIINMSTNLKLSENQMGKYYEMLIPICDKLGIEVPELYVTLDVHPNAYTYGETKPFIVVTSGLFETVPDELIPTVLAHECGHIACHHTLYRTMGRALLSGAASFVSGLKGLALYPIELAFAYWMRCSEYSADRVAAICDGGAEKTIEMCMRLAGYDKDIMAEANVDLFLEQAAEYRDLVNDSGFNKTMEFIMFNSIDHPLNAVRAYESREWANSERFSNIMKFLNSPSDENAMNLPAEINPNKMMGMNVEDVHAELLSLGFVNVDLERNFECEKKTKSGAVTKIVIEGKDNNKTDWYKKDSSIILNYYEPKSDEEIALEHPDEIKVPENYKFYLSKPVEEVETEFESAGFENVKLKEMALPKLSRKGKINTVAKIKIGEESQFDNTMWFDPGVEVSIYYYVEV